MDLESLPFASRRSPVFSSNGMVATSQPLAAQAGLEMLQNGGNAVDAAIATAAALTVLEPTSNGLGSDAFSIIWDGNHLQGINASGRWPEASDVDVLRAKNSEQFPERGWPSVTVPGAVSMWEDLSQRYGRLSIEQLLAPATRFAEKGFPVSPVIAALWRRANEIFDPSLNSQFASWRDYFTRNGEVPRAGEIWFSPGHAACLKGLAQRGLRDFYEGEIAAGIEAYAKSTGGLIRCTDLAAHQNEWVTPISTQYGDLEVFEIPPNGQGIAALQALAMLDNSGQESLGLLNERNWHQQIEAMKLGFADAYHYVADPSRVDVPTRGMLDPDYIATRRQLITEQAGDPAPGKPPGGGTVYLCCADRDGMMISLIQSNFSGFGSGIVVPELGISLQNRGAGFELDPEHLNVAAAGKRPRHTIIPGFLFKSGKPLGPFGVMGGEIQPQGHLQVVAGMNDYQLNPQAALDMPRWRWMEGRRVELEPGTDPKLIEALRRRGHEIEVATDSLSFGRGQIICRLDSGAYVGGSEPRADGMVVGY